MMKRAGLTGLLAIGLSVIGSPATAIENSLKRQFLRLDPATRLEQLCDHEVMQSIIKDKNAYNPDKVIAYTFDEPVMGDHTLKAPGAVFRSRGDWYHLSFRCKANTKNIEVRSLQYNIGEMVPREKWTKYYLYD